MLPSLFCVGLSREPNEGNGWPLASPDAFSASYSVTITEDTLRAVLHPERIDQGKSPKISLSRTLEEQFVAQHLLGFIRWPILVERGVYAPSFLVLIQVDFNKFC